MQIGTVKGQEITTNRDGIADVRMLSVDLGTDAQPDVQSIQYCPMSGDDAPPMNEDQVIVVQLGPAFKVAIGVQDSVVPSMLAGEKQLFSRDINGDIAAFIKFLSGGNLELNGNADFAVRFTALETAFNTLKADLNAHGHTDPQGGSVGPSLPVSAADISPAKVVEVLLP